LNSSYYGYTGEIGEILWKLDVKPGDRLTIRKGNTIIQGVLLPRPELYSGKQVLVLKLDNGYNIGVKISDPSEIIGVERVQLGKPHVSEGEFEYTGKARIAFLSTGGTIASKVDYETGAVKPALSVRDIVEWIPEIESIAYFTSREVMNIFSENIEPQHWERLALEIYREMESGVEGVVVAHGTDFMAYSASAMAFAIRDKTVPIVFVGSQRSSDRPSTDSAFNLKAAFITAVKAPFAESVIVMHGESSDSYALAHRGVKARKMHSSRRDAFQSINDKPLAIIYPDKGEVKVINKIYEERNPGKTPVLMNKFDDKVVLLYTHPGFHPEIIDYIVDKKYHGIVLAGSGLGHVNEKSIPSLKRAVEEGIPVVMTTQCLFGRVNMNVYSTGRQLLKIGVIPASDMLPETAFVKLSWILGSVTRDLREVARLINTNMVGEINERHTYDLFPKWVY